MIVVYYRRVILSDICIIELEGAIIMSQKETTNIIKLKKGFSSDDILQFLTYIETHTPSEEEAKNAIKK